MGVGQIIAILVVVVCVASVATSHMSPLEGTLFTALAVSRLT